MLRDVTGFIVKLIMVNKCWLPNEAREVFVVLALFGAEELQDLV